MHSYKYSIEDRRISDRPQLDKSLASATFRSYYYLKEELVDFCRQNNLPVSGGEIEITDREDNKGMSLDQAKLGGKIRRVLDIFNSHFDCKITEALVILCLGNSASLQKSI